MKNTGSAINTFIFVAFSNAPSFILLKPMGALMENELLKLLESKYTRQYFFTLTRKLLFAQSLFSRNI